MLLANHHVSFVNLTGWCCKTLG